MTNVKQPRADQLAAYIIERESNASLAPAGGPGSFAMHDIDLGNGVRAKTTKGMRKVVGLLYGKTLGVCIRPDRHWRHVELTVHGKRVFAANVKSGEVDLFHYCPGRWEAALGLDNGNDTEVFDRVDFPMPQTKAWDAYMETVDLKSPTRGVALGELEQAPYVPGRTRSRTNNAKW